MMRKVVDSNFLRSDALTAYLSESTNNYVVLTDYAAMEAYKGEMPASIYASMAILTQHPKQVIVLKGTQAVCGLNGRDAASLEQLIDVNKTREFPEYCRALIAAQGGNQSLQKQLLEYGREAAAHMDRILADAGTLLSGFEAAEKAYSRDELKIIRNGNRYTQRMGDKMMHNFMLLAVHLFKEFKERQGTAEITTGPEVRNTFIFRYALCAYLSILKWISIGGTRSATKKPKRIRNDYIVDVNFITFATYFDGLLTAEKKLQEIYVTADFLLREILVMPGA
jgi:hypothetical protein